MLDQTDDSCQPTNIQRHEIPNRYSTVKMLKAKEQVADKYKDRTTNCANEMKPESICLTTHNKDV